MNWLRRPVVFLALLAPASLLHACSGDDNATTPVDLDASQTPIPDREAGSSCLSNTDCVTGLVCLYPATTCEAFRVCTTPPPDPCTSAVTACSCLGEPIQVCAGFATDAIDPTGASCGDSGPVIVPEAGSDDAGDSSLPPADAAGDSGGSTSLDASDAAG